MPQPYDHYSTGSLNPLAILLIDRSPVVAFIAGPNDDLA